MMAIDPFSDKALRQLVIVERKNGKLYVKTREGVHKEFKQSFNFRSLGLYARNMAAFSNARGGYLIFGVTDNPRIAVGLTPQGEEQFNNLDRAQLTSGLNELFSPEIGWDSHLYEVEGASIGLIYTYESSRKPVIARKSIPGKDKTVAEGDILYRYNSRTERVHYPELQGIIEEARSKEHRALMNHLEGIIRAGASNAAVLDLSSGNIEGPSGRKVLIDSQLLSEISFIKEGEFNEVKGAPALKVVGEVQSTNTISISTEKIVHQPLTTEDILRSFLEETLSVEATYYIQVAATGTSGFVPVHFYRKAGELSHDQLIDLVAGITTRSQAKGKLLERLTENDPMTLPPPSVSQQHASTRMKRTFYEQMMENKAPQEPLEDEQQARYFLQAVRSLPDGIIEGILPHLRRIMLYCLDEFYSDDTKVADELRRASCRVDMALYGPHEESSTE